jgi:hypothetical protein
MVASRRRGYRCAALHRIIRGSYTLLSMPVPPYDQARRSGRDPRNPNVDRSLRGLSLHTRGCGRVWLVAASF